MGREGGSVLSWAGNAGGRVGPYGEGGRPPAGQGVGQGLVGREGGNAGGRAGPGGRLGARAGLGDEFMLFVS